jgi:hypothetical protein
MAAMVGLLGGGAVGFWMQVRGGAACPAMLPTTSLLEPAGRSARW